MYTTNLNCQNNNNNIFIGDHIQVMSQRIHARGGDLKDDLLY